MLAQLSDRLWQFGNLGHIRENVSTELFHLQIGINVIGIWKSEGWNSILGEQADFIPYWSEDSETGGWSQVFEYIRKNIE